MSDIGILGDVDVTISVELGRATKKIAEVLEFGEGTIIELDSDAGAPCDVLVNGKVIAKGEVVVIDDKFGVRLVEIVGGRDVLAAATGN
jgi:flagellar motor switch protein FliN/FliY